MDQGAETVPLPFNLIAERGFFFFLIADYISQLERELFHRYHNSKGELGNNGKKVRQCISEMEKAQGVNGRIQ